MPDLPRRRTRLRITSQSSSENRLHDSFGFQEAFIILCFCLPLQQPLVALSMLLPESGLGPGLG